MNIDNRPLLHLRKYENNMKVIKKVSGEDVYKPYDLFSNADTSFVM